MQIVNHLRARFFNSSYSALDLAWKNQKYVEFAVHLVSVKQSSALRDLITSRSESREELKLKYKLNKYDSVLKELSQLRNLSKTDKDAFNDYINRLPQLERKININEYNYCPSDSETEC